MNKYLRAVSYNVLFFIVSVVFFLLITPIAIKVMGSEFFGVWSITNALMLFSGVGTLGIAAIVMKFSSEAPSTSDAEFQGNQIITSGVIIMLFMALLSAIILLCTRNLIVENIKLSPGLKDQFRLAISIVSLSVFPQFLCRVAHGFLLSRLYNRETRQLELLSSILLWLGAVVLAWFIKNLIFIALWCLTCNLLVLFLYVKTVQRFHNLKVTFSLPVIKKMLNFSGYMFIENLAIAMFQQVDKIIVGITLGATLAGVYSVGTSLALRLSIVTGQASEVMIPYASLKESIGDRTRLYSVFRQLSSYVSLLLAGISSLFIIWMKEIISFWISPDYGIHYANTFSILIVAYSWLSLSRPAHQTLTGLGKVKLTSLLYLCSTFLMLGCLHFSSSFGLVGAVSSNLLMLSLLIFNLYLYKIFHNPIQWANVFTDLKWGLFLPTFIYLFTFIVLKPNLTYKAIATFLLIIVFIVIINKDTVAKSKLLRLRQLIFKAEDQHA